MAYGDPDRRPLLDTPWNSAVMMDYGPLRNEPWRNHDIDMEYTLYDHIVPANEVDTVAAWEKTVNGLRHELNLYLDEARSKAARFDHIHEEYVRMIEELNEANHKLWLASCYLDHAKRAGYAMPTVKEIEAEARGAQMEMKI